MSQVIWSKLLIPDLQSTPSSLKDPYYQDEVLNVLPFSEASDQISIPDQRAFRSMSRASIFLSHICQAAEEILKPFLTTSPFSVGIYCAVENGPIDAASTQKIIQQNNAILFSDYYRKFRNPKMYLKQLPNLVPAQMGISLGIQGAMNVYTHSTAGSLQALEQAEWDLKNKTVTAALVCTAHAFDDFMVVKRERHFDSRCLTEAAGAILLKQNNEFTDWSQKIKKDPKHFFGISDTIVNCIRSI
ncbi:MAG: hypothetical protein ACK5WZ_09820 [Pseudobdellovibrionaceae bacterium]